MTPPRELAVFTDYDGMIKAFRARFAELRIATSGENVAEIAGLPLGYIAKLLGPRPVKRIGMVSLGPILGVLGVRLVMVEDPEQVARLAKRLVKSESRHLRTSTVHYEVSKRFLHKIRSLGGKNSRKFMSTKKSRELGRKAALARHHNGKAAQRHERALRGWLKRRFPPQNPQPP